AEIVADRGAAYIQAEARAVSFQVGKIVRRRLREVVGGQFDGIEIHTGGQVDEIVEGHRWFRLALEIERFLETVGGDAQTQMRRAGSSNRLDGRGGSGAE